MAVRTFTRRIFPLIRQQSSASTETRHLLASEAPTGLLSSSARRYFSAFCPLQRSSASWIVPQRLLQKDVDILPYIASQVSLSRSWCPHKGARKFSAAGSKAASDASQQHQPRNGGIEGRIFKGLIFATILAIALKLGPHIAAGNVTHAVKLLDAETPFMKRSGARRIRRLADTGLAGEELRRENAPAKLLGLLCDGADPDVSMAVVEALEAICKEHEGMEATIRAGGTDVLQEAVDQGWVEDVVAREVAASLLVGLKIQEGHLD